MLDTKPTPVQTIHKAYNVGKKIGLNYVYAGNVPGNKSESTYCPKCGKVVIGRFGYNISEFNLTKIGKCKFCGQKIDVALK